MAEWFQQPDARELRPLLPGLRLGASFNPRKVKVGQWFTRLSLQGVDCLPIRVRLFRIDRTETGKHFNFLCEETGRKMGVCAKILLQDFRSIVSGDGQRFAGDALTGQESPQQKRKEKNWYEQD